MMIRQWISTGNVVLLAAAITVITKPSPVESFSTAPSSTSMRIHATSSQSYDRSFVIADESRRTISESVICDSIGVSLLRQTAASIIAVTIATVAIVTLAPLDAWADGQTKDFKFPPIDYSDVNRCILKGGSSMGQANAARDKLYDLRQCKLSGADATGYDLSGVST